MEMYYYNETSIFIANNLVFHECSKHIEFDFHFIQNLLMRKQIIMAHIRSNDQLDDILMLRAVFLASLI
jgi:hypothetical protein